MGEEGLIKFDDPKSIEDLLQRPQVKFAEAITGLLAAGPTNVTLIAGRLVQASLKGKFLKQLGSELHKLIEQGKIKEDYYDSHINQASFYELLKFIDEETPDEERFNAMKALFFRSIAKDSTEEQEQLAYELMQICKQLKANDILVIKSALDITGGRIKPGVVIQDRDHNASLWLNAIAKQIGHDIPSLVELHDENLVNLKLLSERTFADKSGYGHTNYFRLTKLGYTLCKYISQ